MARVKILHGIIKGGYIATGIYCGKNTGFNKA